MKPLYILKIGGSVATYKNRAKVTIRRNLLKNVAWCLKSAIKMGDFDLILIHGAGSAGHSLAKKYDLKNGTGKDNQKWQGALLSRVANGKLNNAISAILISEGLNITPVHTASVIMQNNHQIEHFDLSNIKESLKQNCIPLLYGDMVFDKKLGMSICSGDLIAPYLAKEFGAKKIFFASDIKGIYSQDPYLNKKATLIEKINLNDIVTKVSLSGSHNIDVTGGLMGKISKLSYLQKGSVSSIEIFNGLYEENYKKALLEKKFFHTKIIL